MADVRKQGKPGMTRRRIVGAAAAAMGAPMVASSRTIGPVTMRLQSTWSARDIFHEYAGDFARKVNDVSGGELKIEVLPAGAVAPPAGLLDAVSQGAVDGGHGMFVHHYHRQSALALWGSGPAFGMDANMLLAWHRYGGGKELLARVYASIGANVVSFPYGPMPTQPLGWFKRPVARVEDFKDLKFRTDGIASDLFAAMGAVPTAMPPGEAAAAMSRDQIDAAELNNATTDSGLGMAEASKVCMLQSFHQNAEQFEILFNKTRFDALPARLQAAIEIAVEAASADMSWKAIDRYSRDYFELQRKGVKFYKTPDAVLQRQLDGYDEVAAKRAVGNALFAEIQASQQLFAERVVRWERDTVVDRRPAYNHYFAPAGAARKPRTV
jgi:TRAP-type mannitol/chloroaromatic compound transport system substrate-binding protein